MHADMAGFIIKVFICIYHDSSKRTGDVCTGIKVGGI